MPIDPLSLNAKLIFTTIALMIVWAVEGHAQVSSTKIVVVPVDSATTAQLTSLKLAADEATKAYNKAVDDAKRRILTTRDYVLGSCSAGRERRGYGLVLDYQRNHYGQNADIKRPNGQNADI